MNIDERIARVRAHVEKNEGKERATFSLDGIRVLLEAIDAQPASSMAALQRAYERGANWTVENLMLLDSPDIHKMLVKAAYDYADKETPQQPAPFATLNAGAVNALKNNQRQLDMDGCEVGVSRQALDEALAFIEAALPAQRQAVARLDADDVLNELAALPCETEGPEDLEEGCCRTCRARSILSRLDEPYDPVNFLPHPLTAPAKQEG